MNNQQIIDSTPVLPSASVLEDGCLVAQLTNTTVEAVILAAENHRFPKVWVETEKDADIVREALSADGWYTVNEMVSSYEDDGAI